MQIREIIANSLQSRDLCDNVSLNFTDWHTFTVMGNATTLVHWSQVDINVSEHRFILQVIVVHNSTENTAELEIRSLRLLEVVKGQSNTGIRAGTVYLGNQYKNLSSKR